MIGFDGGFAFFGESVNVVFGYVGLGGFYGAFERFGVLGERFAYLEGSFFGFEEGGGRGGE